MQQKPVTSAAKGTAGAKGAPRGGPAAANTAQIEQTADFDTRESPEDDSGDFILKGKHDKSEAPEASDEKPAPPSNEAPGEPAGEPPSHAAEKAADKPAPSAVKQKATTLGDYKLLKKLGQGGMGAVYKALKMSLDREEAIKILSKELAAKPAFVQRFRREARVMAKLDHSNILRVYDAGEALGFQFLTMEYVEGGSVENWLKKLGKFTIADSLHIAIITAAALQHAHELNMIHRDIKPDNILLTKKGIIKVADLGLAKAIDDDMSLTKTGTGAGTPIYMAPEQARDAKHVDGRVDIYALGCMLYVFITGQPPFKGETLVELIESKEKDTAKPMRSYNSDVPERLDLIVDKMMAKKPEHRYASCAEVIADLESLGLASDRLSFFAEADAAPTQSAAKPAATKAGAGKTQSPQRGGTQSPSAKSAAGPTPVAEEPFFWSYEGPARKVVVKKVTKDQLLALLKAGAIDAQAQLSRTAQGGYRALGTYQEFQHIVQGAVSKEKAEKKTDKMKSIYDKLEKDEKRRQRWKFFEKIYLRTGGLIGLILWLCIVAAVLAGLYFGGDWLIGFIGEKLRGAAKA